LTLISEQCLARLLGNPANLLLIAGQAGSIIGVLFGHFIDRLRLPSSQLFMYEVEFLPE
jgi:hypothetical protein